MRTFQRYLNSLIPLVGCTILIWTYYVYVCDLCIYLVKEPAKKYSYLIIITFFMLMIAWCMGAAICKSVALVPKEYRVSNSDHNLFLNFDENERHALLQRIVVRKNLLLYMCSANGTIRYCIKCRHIKPDRSHHCSTCEVCVLKMDHHCPWINNCVGYSNYKQFFLLVFYVSVYSLFYFCTSLEYFILFFQDTKREYIQFIGGFIMSFVALIVFLVLLGYHIELIAKNETTIESMREVVFCNGNMTFDLGCWTNFKQIFGDNRCLWFIPVFSSLGNGHTFHVIHRVLE